MRSLADIKNELAASVTSILKTEVTGDLFELANPKAGSHIALPCFRFAAALSKSPQDIATMVADELTHDTVERVEAAGPYVNVWISDTALTSLVLSGAEQLEDASDNGKVAVVEYLSPNLAKPLSIGHFRNALQGKIIARNYKSAGFSVITDNHIGDWGTVFGMWVVGFERFSSEEQLAAGGVEELGRMYVEMRKALKEEEAAGGTELAELIQDWLKKLEDDDAEALAYHAKFSKISLANVAEQVAKIGIVFDYNYGESFFVKRGKEMVGELVTSGDAVRNEDGSVIVPLEDQGIDVPMLIEKSNGAALYHTSDIATIEFREKNWNPDLVVYVVGAEQQFHFQQLFAANVKVGWSDAELVHHWYGLIEEVGEDGNRRKMSSRENAVYMSDLLDRAQEKAREIAPEDLTEEDITHIAHGALSFREFSASHTGNTLFDWDSMFSLSGFSGPYVQYAAVRIDSILSKYEGGVAEKPNEQSMHGATDLLWRMSQFQSVVEAALEEREFHAISQFAYDLARDWNRFYENNQVLGSGDDEPARIWLATTVRAYLGRALYLIGVDIPSRM